MALSESSVMRPQREDWRQGRFIGESGDTPIPSASRPTPGAEGGLFHGQPHGFEVDRELVSLADDVISEHPVVSTGALSFEVDDNVAKAGVVAANAKRNRWEDRRFQVGPAAGSFEIYGLPRGTVHQLWEILRKGRSENGRSCAGIDEQRDALSLVFGGGERSLAAETEVGLAKIEGRRRPGEFQARTETVVFPGHGPDSEQQLQAENTAFARPPTSERLLVVADNNERDTAEFHVANNEVVGYRYLPEFKTSAGKTEAESGALYG